MRMKMSNPCQDVHLINLVYFLILIVGINADGCKRGCHRSDSGELKYIPGIAYQYNFDSNINIGIENAQSEQIDLIMNGNAILYNEGNCAYTLKLDNVQVETTLETIKKQMKNDFDKPIQFTMINGELEPMICSEQNDNEFSLNIKRGLVSMFQTTNNKFETDVFGLCQTETSTTNIDGTEIITKIRNLNLCSYRENIVAFYASGIVNEKSGIKSRPFLNGEYVKEQKLLNGIYQNIELNEIYKTSQQTKGKSFVWINAKSHLKLEKQNVSPVPNINNKKSRSIIFDHPNNKGIKNLDVLNKVFVETVNLVSEYTKADSAQHFSELIRLMRNADVNSLVQLGAAKIGLAQKVYFDALIRTGTPESVKAIVRQINSWNDQQKKIAMFSFNLVNSIDLDTLNDVAKLITPDADRDAYLSIGTLVNTYCKKNGCNNGEINIITSKFSEILRNCDTPTKKAEDHIVGILKGVRNVQHITDAITSQLIECANPKRSARIRVAALQAYSASACNIGLQEYAMKLLRDHNEDSEIRIEAYLAAVHCPNGEIANQISEIVNKEEVYQVGSFITSHLKAIRDSADFTKASLKHHLGNIRVTKKFPINPRRFSFNSELSYAIDSLGLGAGIDYSIIYSQKGFLPRSIRLNLTNEAFGTSFNTFEFNMRQENLENILEHYFGPKGFFSQNSQVLFNHLNEYVGSNVVGKSKRNVQEESNKISLQYKNYGSKDNKFSDDINLDVSLKAFGSELAFLSLGNHIPSNSDELMKLLQKSMTALKNGIKSYEQKFEQHTLLHDIEFVYPTGFGLPLQLAVKSSTVVKLDFGIEIDVDKVLNDYKNAKYRLKFIPNQDINFETFIRIDSGVLSTGLRTSSNLHAADGGDITVDLTNSERGFNIDLILPRQNVELIEFKHDIDFFISEQDKELKVLPFKKNKKRKTYQPVCFDQLRMFGLTVCYTANLPSDSDMNSITENNKLPMLFNGPMQMSLILHTQKHMQLQGRHKINNEYQTWQLIYDTPGSAETHKTELSLKFGIIPKFFTRIEFLNIQKTLSGELGISNSADEFVAYCILEMDKMKNIQKIGFTKKGKEYHPLIQLFYGNQEHNDIAGYKADGKIVVDQADDNGAKYYFDNIRIVNPANENTVINGYVEHQLKPYISFDSNLDIKSRNLYKVESHFKREKTSSFSGGLFVTKDNNLENKFGGSVAVEYEQDNFKNEIKLQNGRITLDLYNELERSGEGQDKSNKFTNNLMIKNIKESSSILSGKLNVDISRKHLNCELETASSDKTFGVTIKLIQDQSAVGDLNLHLKGLMNRQFADLKCKVDVRQGKYLIDNTLTTSWGTQLSVKGDINQQISHQNALINLSGSFKLNRNDKENIFLLKVTDTQEKLNSDFKLKRDNAEYISYIAEMQTLPDKQNGNIKMSIKDSFNLQGKFNLNKNGRGDFMGSVHLKKVGKPIKINSKFLYALPKITMDTTILMNDKKINYKTENEFVKANKFKTNNLLEIGTEKLQFDASAITNSDSSETNAEFLIILPTERKFNGNFYNKVNPKNKNRQYKIDLIDTQPDSKTRSINVESLANEINHIKQFFNVDFKIILKNFNDQNVIASVNTKHLPKGDSETAGFKIDLKGTALNNPIKINFILDEFSKQHAIFKIDNSYGKKLKSIINGNYHYKSMDNDNSCSCTYDFSANIQAPETEFKEFDLKTNLKYIIKKIDDKTMNRELDLKLNYKIADKNYDYHTLMKGNNRQGYYNIQLNCPGGGSNKITGTWTREIGKLAEYLDFGKMKYTTQLNLEHFGNTNFEINFDFVENDEINMYYNVNSSNEKLKNIDFKVNIKRENDKTYQIIISLNNNKENYELSSKTYTQLPKAGFEFMLQTPKKVSKVYAVVEKYQEHHIKGEINVENVCDIDLIGKLELKFKNPEDFYAVGEVNSSKLKINNVKGDIKSNNKVISVNLMTADKNILNGNVQYNIKNEKNKILLEGRGEINYKNSKHLSSFRLIRQIFEIDINNEFGFEYSFNGELGKKNFVSTLKVTNKNFVLKLIGCEESKQCTNFEIQSVITVKPNDLSNIVHELMVLIDLRELGYPYELELQSKSSKFNIKILHEIDVTITSNNNKKYKFLANIKPHNNLIQIVLPKRTIVLETVNLLPETGFFGKYENSVTFYFDKLNQPNEKAAFSSVIDLSGIRKKNLIANLELKFENPYLQKPLNIKGQVNADSQNLQTKASIELNIFKSEDQKIVAEAEATSDFQQHGMNCLASTKLYSTGLDFNYKTKAIAKINIKDKEIHFEALAEGGGDMKFLSKFTSSNDKFEFQVITLNQQLFNMKGQYDLNKQSLKTDSVYQIIGSKPIKLTADILPTKIKIVIKRDGLFTLLSELNTGKDAHMQLNEGPDNKQIYNARLSLDPSTFLTTKYEVNNDELHKFMKLANEEISKDFALARTKLNDRYKKVITVVEERLKKIKENVPDFKETINKYQNHFETVIGELEDDPSLKILFEDFIHAYEKYMALLQDVTAKINESYKVVENEILDFYKKVEKLCNETILPATREIVEKFIVIITESYTEAMKIFTQVLERAQKSLKTYENDFKELAKPFYEILKPFADSFVELFRVLGKEWKLFWDDILVYINKLPACFKNLTSLFNEYLTKLWNIDELLVILRDIFQQVEVYTVGAEGREFLNKLYNYIEAKFLNKPVDDVEELEGLYYSFINTLNSLIIQLTGDKSADFGSLSYYNALATPLTFSFDLINKLQSWLTIKISLFNYLLNERFDSFGEILMYKLPSTLDLIPPYQLSGHIADGRHIITFDGRYIEFPGSCRYILAQDSIDNNFTVIANLNNGMMQSIILVDKSNYAEIDNKGLLKLNDKKTEYPVHNKNIHAWRRYYTSTLLSEYGVIVKCSLDLRVCHVTVNGFYTGKTRGLLGNGNSEPYDDYMKLNGEITENTIDFGVSYGVTQCQQIVQLTTIVPDKNEGICNELFNIDSSLMFGYLFVDRTPFRDACNVAVTINPKQKLDVACNIALTYASASNLHNNFAVSLPSQCVKCKDNAGKLINIGDSFTTKIPNTKADVIVIADTNMNDDLLNEFVQPVLNGIRQQLKQRGLNDVHIAVIGFNDKQKYPNLITTNGKLNFNGNLKDATLEGPTYDSLFDVGSNKLNEILEKLREIHAPVLSDLKAIELALDYPFRPNAAKSILVIRENESKMKMMDIIGTPVLNFLFKNQGVLINYVGIVKDLTIDGKPSEKLVGFNRKAIAFLLGLGKRQKLDYLSDPLIDTLVNDESWIFSLNNYKQLKSNENKKQFTNQLSSVVADQLFKTEITSSCFCSLKYGLHGETSCVKTSFEYLPTKKPETQKQG